VYYVRYAGDVATPIVWFENVAFFTSSVLHFLQSS